jgi:hypothetical protein
VNFDTKTPYSKSSFYHDDHKDKAVSYFIAVGADETYPQMILTGDANLGDGDPLKTDGGTPPTKLYTGQWDLMKTAIGTDPATVAAAAGPKAAYGTGIHQKAGNIGLSDGSALQVSTGKLREQLRNSGDPAQLNQALFPNPNKN